MSKMSGGWVHDLHVVPTLSELIADVAFQNKG